ncbi:unnamed protein product [Strongylus vulgaris]|uniref:Uncharacterized protein n=1 Tax=Strongylus vulgaris TaxID=40348 RepID=A0A3P7I7N9_STRVU|nr:unnamed protein product [Strongylus vulgaris]
MQPPPPPICISRVSRYSRMWRHFDVGLYRFLKNQVYIPLLSHQLPTVLAMLRNLATLFAVFGVVLAWHGIRTHYICWVSLSALELVMERLGSVLWRTKTSQEFRSSLGDVNTRRLMAVLMVATVIPGIFGVFFFLGVDGVGSAIFEKLIIQGVKDILSFNVLPMSTGFMILHMVFLGYFYNNVCMEFDEAPTTKKEAKQE